MRNIVKNTASVIVFLAFIAAFGLVFGCPIKRIFGIPCPGCGMTRGCLSLIRLDFVSAMRWHPLCVFVPFLGLIFIFKDTALGKRFWGCTPLLIGIIALCLIVYAVRILLYFPSAPPMDFEENSFIVKIVHRFLLQ